MPVVLREPDLMFAVPFAFFPASSRFPDFDEPSSDLGCDIRKELGVCARQALRLEQDLRRHIFSVQELQKRLRMLAQVVGSSVVAVEKIADRLSQNHDPASGRDALYQALPELPKGVVKGFATYDEYFRVIRVENMSAEELACQILRTTSQVLWDLTHAILSLDEITALIQSIGILLATLDTDLLTSLQQGALSQSLEMFPAGSESRSRDFEAEDPTRDVMRLPPGDREHWVATYRWKIGHHLFNLISVLCAEYLTRARRAVEAREDASVIHNIGFATAFLRGSTAAMWYAGNFPTECYARDIRLQMISTDQPHGFSGTQNAEYCLLKKAKGELKRGLFESFGREGKEWCHEGGRLQEIYESYANFLEIVVEDNEHHILIAALKVGRVASLAQEDAFKYMVSKVGEERAHNLPRVSALEMLRAMAQQKREELNQFIGA